ncbi:GrpB family protein [Alkalihalobacillus sp. LMS6]|uniref:GrpB family protein n=1 Tax=Alkalihalobacillus sp. LMS6 TaxID=2924034 RepID=UPI0020D0E737|nr:GrpB family protein [Alkalihalobacillus sp. LMS6]UTR05261.1 GrpB family protein [Alkalihalobacillus sp. LMS6]
MLGLKNNDVYLLSHQKAWSETFQTEKQRLTHLLRAFSPTIEHIGSTAIPGIRAKPLLDLCVGIQSLTIFEQFPFEKLKQHHYYRLQNVNLKDRFVMAKFTSLETQEKSVVLHIVEHASPTFKSFITFRDYLQSHPSDAEGYEALKIDLAQRFPSDQKAYTKGKEAFIASILKKAGDGL